VTDSIHVLTPSLYHRRRYHTITESTVLARVTVS